MIGSHLTGATSIETGQGSTLTAGGVCAPFPGLFVTDGASFTTGTESVPTAGEPPACGPEGCDPGTVLWDQTYPPTQIVATGGDAYELSSIPFDTFGTGRLRVTITLDCSRALPPGFQEWLFAYINAPGLNTPTRDFTFSYQGAFYCLGLQATATFNMKDATGWDSGGALYVDFVSDGSARSIYFWPPFLPPAFQEDTYTFSNVHVTVTCEGPE